MAEEAEVATVVVAEGLAALAAVEGAVALTPEEAGEAEALTAAEAVRLRTPITKSCLRRRARSA